MKVRRNWQWFIAPLLVILSLNVKAASIETREQILAEAQKSKDAHDLKKAQSIYEKWLKTHSDDRDVEFRYAQVLSWRKDYSSAEAIYTRLLQEDPKNKDVAFALAQLYAWEGNAQKSLTKLELLIAADPTNKEYQSERERVVKQLSESCNSKARLGFDFKSYSFYDQASLGFRASFDHTQKAHWALRAAAYGLTRFGEGTGQVALGGSYWISPTWIFEADVDMSVHSNVLPLFSLGVGTNITIARALTPSFNFQVSQYSNATVLIFSPGLSWTIVDPLELSAKFYATFTSFSAAQSAGTVAGYVKLTYTPFDFFAIHLGTAAGQNAFDPGNPNIPLGNFIAYNLFGGFKFSLDQHWGADFSFDQEWRNNSQSVFSGELGVSYRW